MTVSDDRLGREFLGVGWAFPPRIDSATGLPARVSYEEDIQQSILIILTTAKGERVMRPDFGCAMWEMLFAPLTGGTLGLIEQSVREALERWEPRVELESVVADGEQATGTVHITVAYRVRATNDIRNLVFPFYTIPTEEPAS